MDLLVTLLIGLLIFGLIALYLVIKFDKFMALKNFLNKKDKKDNFKQ